MATKHKFDYFDTLLQMSALAVEEIDLLIRCIENYVSDDEMEHVISQAHEIEHKADCFGHAILNNVANDFITPLDREDIVELTHSLDSVIDHIEDVMQRFYMCGVGVMHEDALQYAKTIRKSCVALNEAMGDFTNYRKSKKVRQLIVDINTYEEEADRLHVDVMRKLHTSNSDRPLYVFIWSQVFSRLEKCSDACEHVADKINIVLAKNA